jgi:hypothetical protein
MNWNKLPGEFPKCAYFASSSLSNGYMEEGVHTYQYNSNMRLRAQTGDDWYKVRDGVSSKLLPERDVNDTYRGFGLVMVVGINFLNLLFV